MSYDPLNDFLSLSRLLSGGVRQGRAPTLDVVIEAMARMGQFSIYVGTTAPTTNQQTTVWLLPVSPSWSAESSVFLYNTATGQYEAATPALWAILIPGVVTQIVQDVAVAGPTAVLANANIVRVGAVGGPCSLVMPLAASKVGAVLITDWNNLAGANNITITRSGADVFPNGATSLTIAGDSGSYFLRPVSGGYVY